MIPEFVTTEALLRWALTRAPSLMPIVVEMDEYTHVWVVGPLEEGKFLVYEAT